KILDNSHGTFKVLFGRDTLRRLNTRAGVEPSQVRRCIYRNPDRFPGVILRPAPLVSGLALPFLIYEKIIAGRVAYLVTVAKFGGVDLLASQGRRWGQPILW